MSSNTIVLFFNALWAYLGKELNLEWRSFKIRWRAKNGWPKQCAKCGKKLKEFGKNINKKDIMTLDHIIPKHIIFELELPELLWDYNNFEMHCRDCNSRKSNKVPESISKSLQDTFNSAIDRRNKEIYDRKVFVIAKTDKYTDIKKAPYRGANV